MLYTFNDFFDVKILQFLYAIGFFGEQIAFIAALFVITNISKSPLWFILGAVLNKISNEYMKNVLSEKRPSEPQKFLESDKFIGSKTNFGLPSGHTQGVAFMTSYAYFMKKDYAVQYILLNALVAYERFIYRNHTMFQLGMGIAIGTSFAYLWFQIYQQYFVNNI